ncbi:MAG: PorV/PorQ family protein [Candidatus Cloacimonadaceae bacterium]
MFKRNTIVLMALAMLLAIPATMAGMSQGTLLFLTIEPGARANAMGRAYTAVADDAYAPWWNPGATAFNRKTQLAGTHVPWLQGTNIDDLFYEYLGWNQYFQDIGNINVHLTLLDYGTQPNTDEAGNYLGDFHSFGFATTVGYSYEAIAQKLGVGANFKLAYEYLGPGQGNTEDAGSALAFAFDLGAKARDIFTDGLDFGLTIQNIGPDVTHVDEEQSGPTPMTVRLGAAYRALDDPISKLTLSVEASKILANEDALLARFISGWDPIDETIFGAGIEYTYLQLLSLRGGYFADHAGEIVGPSFGVGIEYKFDNRYRLTADFGMIVAGDLADYNKIFSVGFDF